MWTVAAGAVGFLGGLCLGAFGGYILAAIEIMKADILLARVERHSPAPAQSQREDGEGGDGE